MKKTLFKDLRREMHKSLGRFISILLIVAIGVAFFAGVKASAPAMKETADNYYDETNLMDIKLMSTLGLTNEDVEEIKKIEGIEAIKATHSMDALTLFDSREIVLKVMGQDFSNTKNDNKEYFNQIVLSEGRLPEKENECIIEAPRINHQKYKVGDKITLTSGNDTDINDTLKTTEYTIVGSGNVPYYLSFSKGSSEIGSGTIDSFIIIPESNYKNDIYTEAMISIKGSKELNSYSDEYFDIINPVTERLKTLGITQAKRRTDTVKNEALKKIDDAQILIDTNKKKYDEEILKAENKLKQGKSEYEEGIAKLEVAKKDIEVKEKEGNANLALAQKELEEGKAKYAIALKDYNEQVASAKAGLVQIETSLNDLYSKQKSTTASIEQIKQAIAGTSDLVQKQALQKQLVTAQAGLDQINKGISTAEAKKANINTGLSQGKVAIEQAKATLDQGEVELNAGKQALKAGITKGKVEIETADKKLIEAKKDIETGTLEFNKEKENGAKELTIAQDKVNKSKEEVAKIENAEWYVLDRNSHYSYREYGAAADRMDAIAKVFPLFFFLVAALVCLTTMTRMVDEQRSEIGTLKALGYSKIAIASKYIIYAAVASLLGSFIGAAIGMVVFPTVIYDAWAIMYALPKVKLVFEWQLVVIATVFAVGITCAAALAASYSELVETPALLMRPKAPKMGKKILLERVTFIWKHFGFTQKVTARNIFRYKKRFFMTIIGIAGCTALLLTGFGIRDSIGDIAKKQYGEIQVYDVSAKYNESTSIKAKEETVNIFKTNEQIKAITQAYESSGIVSINDKEYNTSIVVPSEPTKLNEFLNLKHRQNKEELKISNDGVIISEKLAKKADLSIGDKIKIDETGNKEVEVTISDICENYVGHYMYMSESYYKLNFGQTANNNTMWMTLKEPSSDNEAKLTQTLLTNDNVHSTINYSGVAETFNSTISSLDIIVVVLIISAGLLAIVVLYNLTNVNISERLREIATIKVLGFYDKEVSSYVYRENIVLTFIGAFVGLMLGIGLHVMVMSLAELDDVMFGRNIAPLSFILAVLITLAFSCFVNLIMYKKLKNIPMVESLKSVE
ncbi:MAG: FtsX-like permease family protein [Erysipelotrichaceae bacterium]